MEGSEGLHEKRMVLDQQSHPLIYNTRVFHFFSLVSVKMPWGKSGGDGHGEIFGGNSQIFAR